MWPTDREAILRQGAEAGLTLQEIGAQLGITRERVRQLLNRMGINLNRKTIRADRIRQAMVDEERRRADSLVAQAIMQQGVPLTERVEWVRNPHLACRLTYWLDGKPVRFYYNREPYPTGGVSTYWRMNMASSLREDAIRVLATPLYLFVWRRTPECAGTAYVRFPDPDLTSRMSPDEVLPTPDHLQPIWAESAWTRPDCYRAA